MNKMTYQEAYDKIIKAYFKNEIQPYLGTFCFCGTLANNKCEWSIPSQSHNFTYTFVEFKAMERVLLRTIRKLTIGIKDEDSSFEIFALDGGHNVNNRLAIENHPNYENALFQGMCEALDVLKEIHKERGEDVDSVSALTKRQLVII